ncbi:uncharacterized protein LOC143864475 [Tasmannia lanceolata]|uniref:uncharacterized protein LOC143864475 n=1 Tax=Tasmannia lanceolata TaxID=3420 RepID=UPI004062D589
MDGLLYSKGSFIYLLLLLSRNVYEFHSTPIGGHAGIHRTYIRLATNFFWKSMRADVHKFVLHCVACQQIKSPNVPSYGLLQPLNIPEQVLEDLSLDFITHLPTSHSFSVILVVVHRSPFEVVIGRLPPNIPAYCRGSTKLEALDQDLGTIDELLHNLKENLVSVKARMKAKSDAHRTDLHFQEGDWALLKLQPYRQVTVGHKPNHKPGKKFFGPFQILNKVGLVAYKLKLPEGSQIHPVFHISVLKPFHGDPRSVVVPLELPLISINSRPVIEPVAILNERQILHQGKWIKQSLVQWKQLPLEETSWEDADEFHLLFPSIHLEDKVVFNGGGNDTLLNRVDGESFEWWRNLGIQKCAPGNKVSADSQLFAAESSSAHQE